MALDANVSALKCLLIILFLLHSLALHMSCFRHTFLPRNPHIWFILHLHVRYYLALGSIEELLSGP